VALTYMLALPDRRGLRAQWHGACALLMPQTDAAALTGKSNSRCSTDAKLDLRTA